MRDNRGFLTWTYVASNGQTEDVWNPIGAGVSIPDTLVFKDGVTVGSLDPLSGKWKGKGWTPPAGMRMVQPFTPQPNPAKHSDVVLGWPGQTSVA